MIRELINRAIAGAVAAGAAFVAIVALGATLYYALSLVLVPLGAAASTAGVFALIAVVAFLVFNKKAQGDDEDDYEEEDAPEGVPAKLLSLLQQRPVIGVVGALAAGAILLKKPGLAALALTAFNETKRHDSKSSSASRRNRRR